MKEPRSHHPAGADHREGHRLARSANHYVFEVAPRREQDRDQAGDRERSSTSRCRRCGRMQHARQDASAWAATQGKRSDWKKAIVTLKPDQTIELFEAGLGSRNDGFKKFAR